MIVVHLRNGEPPSPSWAVLRRGGANGTIAPQISYLAPLYLSKISETLKRLSIFV